MNCIYAVMSFFHTREALQNAASSPPGDWLQVLHASMHKTEQNKQALLKHALNGASLLCLNIPRPQPWSVQSVQATHYWHLKHHNWKMDGHLATTRGGRPSIRETQASDVLKERWDRRTRKSGLQHPVGSQAMVLDCTRGEQQQQQWSSSVWRKYAKCPCEPQCKDKMCARALEGASSIYG